MKRQLDRYKEELMDVILAIFIGVIIGAVDAVFGIVLLKITEFRMQHIFWLVPILPIAGLIILFLYKRFNEECMKGMTLVFQTGLGDRESIPKMLIPLVIVCTWITHLFGGSAGREGVAVQLGATIAHTAGRIYNRPNNSRILLITGMAAGFAGLFQTPFAATLFAMEVMIAGAIQYDALLPALTAAFVASKTSHFLGLEKFTVKLTGTLDWNIETVWKMALVSICFGVVGGMFAYLLKKTKGWMAKLIHNPFLRIGAFGIVLASLLLLLHSGRYSGLGTNLINDCFNYGKVYGYDWVLKLILTILTLAIGYQGGEVTPLFAIGATLGAVLATVLGLPIALIAALGYAAVFGSATNTILAPMIIGAEIFGPEYILYFAIVCSIAYVFNGNQTIYGAQVKFNYFQS